MKRLFLSAWASLKAACKRLRSPAVVGLVVIVALASGCATAPPKNKDNLCAIFNEKDDWYDDAKTAADRWGASIPVMMAIMHQESRFVSKAKPPRTRILWIFPGPRSSSAYGYSQALDSTWRTYQRASGEHGADRDDFDDAVDFIGWYNHTTGKRNGIKKNDAYHLYLAYHEGHGGFKRRTFKNKTWLKKVAKKVSARSTMYRRQLNGCRDSLESSWWPF